MKQRTVHLAATGARIATGTAVAAACVLGVAASVAAPWPVLQSTPASTTVTPMPGDSTIVCNGSFRALGRDSSRADLLVSAVFRASASMPATIRPARRPCRCRMCSAARARRASPGR